MANIHDCLNWKMKTGGLDRARGRAAQTHYQQLVERYAAAYPRHQAQAMAAEDLKEATRLAARKRYHATVNQLQAARRLQARIANAPDPAMALRGLLKHSEGSGDTGESIDSLAEAYFNHTMAIIRKVLDRHSLNIVGSVRDQAGFENLLREVFGQATDDRVARELAEAVDEANEFLRQSFNSFGGDVPRLEHYGVRASHDAATIRQAGFDRWRETVERALDWTKIVDHATGRPFAEAAGAIPDRAATDLFLRDVFDSITTRGWDQREPSGVAVGTALYNQRQDHRVLHFTADGWLAYNREFGGSDPFSSIMQGLRGYATDVAMMRVLGPNPRAGLEFASQVALKRARTLAAAGGKAAAKMEAAVDGAAKLAKATLAEIDGSASVPARAGWARFFQGTRAVIGSTQLGSAILSSATDLATISVASKAMGMNPASVLGRIVKLTASRASREDAARAGFVQGSLADAMAGYSRFMGRTMAGGVPERLIGFVLRAQGLTFMTDMERIAVKMEFAGTMAANAARNFDGIDAPLRKMFEARGIGAADWDALRAPEAMFRTESGETFITPYHWLNHQSALPEAEANGLAMRLSMMIEEQLELAVPSSNVEARAWLLRGAAPGTAGGELLRSTLMYRGYTLSLMLGQYRRFMAIPTPMGKAAYAAGLMVPALMLGAMAVQLKELAKGRDPRPMDERKFWLAALMQSGGLGIFGDFFASETSRAGGGLPETIAGPVVGLAGDILGPIASNASRAMDGKDLLLGRDFANFLRFNTPVASSLWQGRTAFDRIVADQVQSFLDPEAELQWSRRERQRAKEFGNEQWWSSGEMLPERAPDLSNAAGAS